MDGELTYAPPPDDPVKRSKARQEFQMELARLINRYSQENGSNTPDFVLAEYLIGCLEAFEKATIRRDDWYGMKPRPGA